MRVALLTNVLSPYRVPVFRDLAATPGLELRILLSARTEFHWRDAFADAYEEGRRHLDVELVPSLSFERRVAMHRESGASQRVSTHLPYGLLPALARHRPHVVVSGELGARSALAALYAQWRDVPLVLWSYASRAAADATPTWQVFWRSALLGRADAVVGMGRQAREGLLDLGVSPERLFDAPNAHDHARIESTLAGGLPLAARAALRARIGGRENVALVAGRLVEAKGIRPLLACWRELPVALRDRWTLLFLGDGPLATPIARLAEQRPGEIAHLPAVAPAAMPEIYAACDRLVFPSLGDPWGLVVNEALACGLPAICSIHAGCADDLIEPGHNGWLFDPARPAAAAASLVEALECRDDERLALCARDTAKRFAPATMAGGFRRAIRAAVGQRATVR